VYSIILLKIFFLFTLQTHVNMRKNMPDSGNISNLCSVLFMFFQLLSLFSNISIIYTSSKETVTARISEMFGRSMISCVYLLIETKAIYLRLHISKPRFIMFFFGILVEYELFIFFNFSMFYEKLSCKQFVFSVNNTSAFLLFLPVQYFNYIFIFQQITLN